MADIAWLNELSRSDLGKAGGKGINLAEMYNLKLPVPPAFVVTAQVYTKFLEETGIKEKILSILKGIDVENNEELQEASRKVQEIIMSVEMPESTKEEILEAYDNMNVDAKVFRQAGKEALDIIKAGRDMPYVAVRSSATAEDREEASFAGQQATYLNVKGKENLLNAVQKCWASLFTARAIYYREKNNFPHEKVLIAVIVQKMIRANKSGVMFSINPLTNNESEIVIEAGFGLGEAVVSGAITPDEYVIDKNNLNLKEKRINRQEWMYTLDPNVGHTVKRKLTEEKGKEQILNDFEMKKLAEYAIRLQEHYNTPQDIEYAIEGSQLYILQTRPVTTLKKPYSQKEEKKEGMSEIRGREVVLKGQEASPGIGKGRVKIVHSIDELGKVREGDVMVTRMTNPDMVPAMKRATAIITDTGGMTSHAAIVSREMGIPCVVGTEKATQILKDGDFVTVNATRGEVYRGDVEIEEKREKVEEKKEEAIETVTEIKVIMDMPEFAERAAATGADGVGLLRLEMMIAENKIHPIKYIREGRDDEYTEMIANGIRKIAEAFRNKPVWVRTSDMRTDEYRNLEGGEEEPKETDPMIGWHGIRRSLDEPRLLKAEFKAIKKLHDEGLTNIGVMLPFVINVDEVIESKKIIKEVGLEPGETIDFGVMIETPASCGIIDKICKTGIDFVSFGTNDLTQLTLGIDRNNSNLARLYDEMHPAVLKQIQNVIKVCKEYNVETSICGQAGSEPDMAEFLVRTGIDSISANPDAVHEIRRTVAKAERKLLLNVARKDLSV